MVSSFPSDDRTDHLLRESTRLKDGGDVAAALVCLAEVKQRMLVSSVTYPIETWCKYARYLLYAGQFDEALAELEWLLSDIPHRYSREYVDNPFAPGTRSKKLREVKVSAKHSKAVIEKVIERVNTARLKAATAAPKAVKSKRSQSGG